MSEGAPGLHAVALSPREVPGHLAYLTAQTALGWLSVLAVIALPLFPLWAHAAAILEVPLRRAGLVAPPPASRPTNDSWRVMAHALTSIPVAVIGTVAWTILVAAGGVVVQAPLRALADQPVIGGASGPTGPSSAVLAVTAGLLALAATSWFAAVVARVASVIATKTLWTQEEVLQAHIEEMARRQVVMDEAAAGERARLERILHDGAQLHLAATAMHLSMIELTLQQVSEPTTRSQLVKHLEAARDENERALDDVRSVASGLRPDAPASLTTALTRLVDKLPISGTADVDIPPLTAEVEPALLLIAKEAVTNALRHSGCSAVTITARKVMNQIVLTIHDDGAGGVDPDRGTGVTGMRMRARSLGGGLTITSPAGGPTSVRVTIPHAGTEPD
ncbi:ATP-binding protein [Micromonosporaceae bacterium B7E4]